MVGCPVDRPARARPCARCPRARRARDAATRRGTGPCCAARRASADRSRAVPARGAAGRRPAVRCRDRARLPASRARAHRTPRCGPDRRRPGAPRRCSATGDRLCLPHVHEASAAKRPAGISSHDEPAQTRRQRSAGLGDQPRVLAHVLGRGAARAGAGMRRRGIRRGHQLHRHGQRVRPGRRRGGARRGARRARALLLRARDEGLLPDVRQRPRSVGASRSTSRSTRRSSACAPTMSISTNATATTTTRRCRRR